MEMFVIDGEPQGKLRVRASFKQKRIYTPSKTLDYEQLIKANYHGHKHYGDAPIGVEITAYFGIPTSTTKKRKEQMLLGKMLPLKKSDADNIAKVILDGLNKVAYYDDKQVCKLIVNKFYDTNPRVEVKVWKITKDAKTANTLTNQVI